MQARILSGPFRGARVHLPWRGGKRKILGVYEHETHEWWNEVLPQANIFIDVGAGEGYFTYGVSHALLKMGKQPKVIAFEPGMEQVGLSQMAKDSWYDKVEFEFYSSLVGKENQSNTVTLDEQCSDWKEKTSETIVKVDVEGVEELVLRGANNLLKGGSHWIVEVHGRERIDPVKQVFAENGRKCRLIEPKSHWLLGKEGREEWTGWVVTE